MSLHGGQKTKDGLTIKQTLTHLAPGQKGPDDKPVTAANPAYKAVDAHGKVEIVRK